MPLSSQILLDEIVGDDNDVLGASSTVVFEALYDGAAEILFESDHAVIDAIEDTVGSLSEDLFSAQLEIAEIIEAEADVLVVGELSVEIIDEIIIGVEAPAEPPPPSYSPSTTPRSVVGGPAPREIVEASSADMLSAYAEMQFVVEDAILVSETLVSFGSAGAGLDGTIGRRRTRRSEATLVTPAQLRAEARRQAEDELLLEGVL